MAVALKEVLRNTLDNLSGADFKRFKHHLKDQGPIPWGKLERADTDDTLDLMVQTYTMGAGGVVVTILQRINHNQLSMDLERELGKLGTQQCSPGLVGGNEGGVIMNMAAHCGGTVNAPALAGCTISGPVSFTFGGATMAQQGEVSLTKASDQGEVDILQDARGQLKSFLKKEYTNISEGISKQGERNLLNAIFTELYITEGESKGVNQEHEVWQIETTARDYTFQHTSIRANDIFKPLPNQRKEIKTVLTKGIAGIGKSVLVQKFALDWAEDKHNSDIDFVIFLSFRKLNRHQGKSHSLHSLLSLCYPDLKELNSDKIYKNANILFILDGFDESKLGLFKDETDISSIMEVASVDTLISNLIQGTLLPSARIWITSRPAAANQIPPDCIDQVTEVRGFKDPQKEEYFRQRAGSEQLANEMIAHVKNCRSLYIMCHIPVFCWMVATILEMMLSKKSRRKSGALAEDENNDGEGMEKMTSLTGMYARFLTCQTRRDKTKFQQVPSRPDEKQIIQNLSRLAFKQLQKGNLVFEAEDLQEFNIDLSKDSVFSTMCTEMVKEDADPFSPDESQAFSFIHLSMQEFLAALHVFQAYLDQDKEALSFFFEPSLPPAEFTLDVLLCAAVDKALESKGGQLDLFLRFLLGIVLESNQHLLKNVLTRQVESSESVARTIKHIKTWRKLNPSPERCMNLILCLLELEDNSLYAEVQEYLKADGGLGKSLTPAHCSALAYVQLMSDKVCDEFDLKKYRTSVEGRRRLIPAVKCYRKAMFGSCELSVASCESIKMVLQSPNSHLRILDLSCNPLTDDGVEKLADGLISPLCKVEELKLTCCGITEKSCEHISPALRGMHLKVIDLSENELKDAGMEALFAGPNKRRVSTGRRESGKLGVESKVERIRLARCAFSKNCCETLASVLTTNSNLMELDLSDNDIGDAGLQSLCSGLGSAHCRTEILRLSGCMITEDGCKHLLPLLAKDTTHLKELDLSYNHLGDTAQKSLSELAENKLKQINMEHGGELRIRPGLAKYASKLTLDRNTAHRSLLVSEEDRKVSGQQQLLRYPINHQRFEHCEQVLCREPLRDRHYWEVDWTRSAVIGVTYAGISRKGRGDDCRLGFNNKSWTLSCDKAWQTVCHQSKSTELSRPLSSRVGIFLDWSAGSLSFYGIAAGKAKHLHTFKTKFTEALYPGFKVNSLSSVKLCTM